jgi:hypothetical protein
MVEVSPKAGPIRIDYWRYLAVLLFLFLLLFLLLWGVLGSQWGAGNPWAEFFRKHLSRLNKFRPSAKPEDNLANALRIFRVERLSGNRYAFLFSLTDEYGDAISPVPRSDVTIAVGDPGATPRPVAIDRITPLRDLGSWGNRVSFSAVMDYSGSMFPEDLDAIEQNYSTFINGIAFPFSASIVKFHSQVDEILPLSPSLTDIESAIKRRIPLGGTALFNGMMKGLETIRPREHLRFLLLTTDGNNNIAGSSLEDVITDSRQSFIPTFVFGFGWLKVDVLKRISDETDGFYVYVPDSADLKNKFPKMADIVNKVQVAEFSSTIDIQPGSPLEITVNTKNGVLKRTR